MHFSFFFFGLLRHHHSDILCEKRTEFGRRNTQTLHTCYLCEAFTPNTERYKFCLQDSVQQFARVSIGMATHLAFTTPTATLGEIFDPQLKTHLPRT